VTACRDMGPLRMPSRNVAAGAPSEAGLLVTEEECHVSRADADQGPRDRGFEVFCGIDVARETTVLLCSTGRVAG
jgi:hypothetical protein